MTNETTTTGEVVDITPNDLGYRRLAAMFAEQVVSGSHKARREANREFLVSIVEISAYLGQNQPTLVAALKEAVKSGRPL